MPNRQPITVSVSFDLKESLDAQGFQIPDDETLQRMKQALEASMWYEIENHFCDIIEVVGIELVLQEIPT